MTLPFARTPRIRAKWAMLPKIKSEPGHDPVRSAVRRPAKPDHRVRNGAVRREQTRRRIMIAALKVFGDKGPDAASIDDFVDEAGISRGTFYNHFRTTQQLLDAVSAELSDGVMEVIDAMVLTYDDPIERMAAGCLSYMRLAIEHRAWGKFILRIGLQGQAGGKLINIYLPRDLELARNLGLAKFPDLQTAHDLVMGTTVRSIQTVILGNAEPDHIRNTLELVFIGLSVDAATARRLCQMPMPELSLSGTSDFSLFIRDMD